MPRYADGAPSIIRHEVHQMQTAESAGSHSMSASPSVPQLRADGLEQNNAPACLPWQQLLRGRVENLIPSVWPSILAEHS